MKNKLFSSVLALSLISSISYAETDYVSDIVKDSIISGVVFIPEAYKGVQGIEAQIMSKREEFLKEFPQYNEVIRYHDLVRQKNRILSTNRQMLDILENKMSDKNAIKFVQRTIKTNDDGIWGPGSQAKLEDYIKSSDDDLIRIEVELSQLEPLKNSLVESLKSSDGIEVAQETFSPSVSISDGSAVGSNEEGDITADWISSGAFETEWDKGFRNDPDARPLRPSTTAFWKGPFVNYVRADLGKLDVFPSTYQNPFTPEIANELVFNAESAIKFDYLDVFKINSNTITINDNIKKAFIKREQGQPVDLVVQNRIAGLKTVGTLVVQEPQHITMAINTDNSFDKNNISCQYNVEVNDTLIFSGSNPEDSKFSSRKPFPAGEYKFEYDIQCFGWGDGTEIKKIDFQFIGKENSVIPVVSLPYVNRDAVLEGDVFEPPVLKQKVVSNDGSVFETAIKVNSENISALSEIPLSNGVFPNTHSVSKTFTGDFMPKEAGYYQFMILTQSNVCATTNLRDYKNGQDVFRFLGLPRQYLPNPGFSCTDDAQRFTYYLSHPIASVTKNDGSKVAITGQGRVVVQTPQKASTGSLFVEEGDVDTSIPLTFSVFSGVENGGANIDAQNGLMLADVYGNWGGLAWNKIKEGSREKTKVVKFASDIHKPIHNVSFYVRGPKDKYFRPLTQDDFVKIEEKSETDAIDLDWLNGSTSISDKGVISNPVNENPLNPMIPQGSNPNSAPPSGPSGLNLFNLSNR